MNYQRGYFAAMDEIMNFVNTLDTQSLSSDEIKK